MELRQSLTRALVGVAVEWPGLVLPLLTWVAEATVMITDPRGSGWATWSPAPW